MPLPLSTIQARMMTAGAVTFPRTIAKLESLISDGEAKAQVIASVVATDPALAALVIGQANTGGTEVLQLTQAIRLTGMGVVLTTARSALPVADSQRKALASAWAQANACAVLMPILVDYRRYHLKKVWDPEHLLLAGLVHDLGHVLSMVQFPSEYARACRRLADREGVFTDLLNEEIGASPDAIATLAARAWSLPPLLTAAMTGWRKPVDAGIHTELCSLIHVAHHLVQAAGFISAGDRYLGIMDPWTLSSLDMRTSDCETVLGRLFDDMDELELFEGALGG